MPDETPIDYLARVRSECDVHITDQDVDWARKVFLTIVTTSAKFGRKAGEAVLAKFAAERRASQQQKNRCATCAQPLTSWTGPAYKFPDIAKHLGVTNQNHYLSMVGCPACDVITEARPM